MAQGIDEAQRQRELTKQALARTAGRIEAEVRELRDWRGRLRRDGPRIAAIGAGAVLLVGTLLVIRSRVRRRHTDEVAGPATLEEVAAELRALRAHLDRGGEGGRFWQKALLRGVAAAGAAGGTYAAKRMLDLREATEKDEGALRS